MAKTNFTVPIVINWEDIKEHISEEVWRKKGEWIVDEKRFGNTERHCSLCGAILEGDDWKWRNNYYCYHCGAKMIMNDLLERQTAIDLAKEILSPPRMKENG